MAADKATVLLAYRHLYQHLLRAVQYSIPARFEARDRLRAAFRRSSRQEFNEGKVKRTLEFLHGAAQSRGLEHHILKNLMFVYWTQGPRGDMPPPNRESRVYRESALKAVDSAVRKLNETMGLCLK